jgi:type IV pilus assembly protein PilB
MIIDRNIEKVLIKEGVLTQEQLDRAIVEHKKTKENLTSILVRLGYASEEGIIKAISKHYEIPYEEITAEYVEPDVIKMIKPELARKFQTIPVNLIANQMTVAMSDPLNLITLDTLSFTLGKKIKPIICKVETINSLIDHFFGMDDEFKAALESEGKGAEAGYYYVSEEEPEKTEIEANAAPIIKLVNQIIAQAVKTKASDIHIEGAKRDLLVRFRVDGVLRQINTLPKNIQPSVVARIKIMSSLDIAERIKPQDGRFSIRQATGNEIDFRVSTYSTVNGESVVMRILDQSKAQIKLSDLGLSDEDSAAIKKVLKNPTGMIIVCGPTGSGKTTTLYALLNELNTVEKKIITIEDPVEYRMPLLNQIMVNIRRGLTFPSILRAALRQDPDIILVGEIRDKETAEISVHAALTGHLLLTTLHTNSPAEAFGRLTDMGIERYYLTDVLSLIIGQRLVRRLCQRCKEPYTASREEIIRHGIKYDQPDLTFYKSQGCNSCDFTGYRGMTGIYEMMVMSEDIRDIVSKGESVDKIRHESRRLGSASLWDSAIKKVSQGIISINDAVKFIPHE